SQDDCIPLQPASSRSAQTGTSWRQRTAGRSAVASSTIARTCPCRVGGTVLPLNRFQLRTSPCPRQPLAALRDPAGQLGCLPDPARHELLVEVVVLVDVELAHVLALGLAGREWAQRRTAEERDFHVLREAV